MPRRRFQAPLSVDRPPAAPQFAGLLSGERLNLEQEPPPEPVPLPNACPLKLRKRERLHTPGARGTAETSNWFDSRRKSPDSARTLTSTARVTRAVPVYPTRNLIPSYRDRGRKGSIANATSRTTPPLPYPLSPEWLSDIPESECTQFVREQLQAQAGTDQGQDSVACAS